MKLLPSIVLALCLSACGEGPMTANVTTTGPEGFRTAVENTLTLIELGVGDPGFLRAAPKNDLDILVRVEKLPAGILGRAWVPEDFDESCDIDIDEDVVRGDSESLKIVILHEIGHCFGLPHTNSPADIMFAYADSRQKTQESLDNFFLALQAARGGVR